MFKCEKIPLILRIFRNPNKTESLHVLDKGSVFVGYKDNVEICRQFEPKRQRHKCTGYDAESFFFTGLTYTLFSCFLLEKSAF